MPMQDGKFFDGVESRPIGRAIFIFGGGRFHRYELFSELPYKKDNAKYIQGKVPDFISRLRGHINICGCNAVGSKDEIFKIRRALLLRSLLNKNAPQLFRKKKLRIDQNVLRALFKIDRYYHGNRSMQAIIEMSNLTNINKFESSALPNENQLNMHVNALEFNYLLMRDTHFEEIKDNIVEEISNWKKEGLAKKTRKDLRKETLINTLSLINSPKGITRKFIVSFVNAIPAIFDGINYSLIKERTYSSCQLVFCKENTDERHFKAQIEKRICDMDLVKQNIENSRYDETTRSIVSKFFAYPDVNKEIILENLLLLQNLLASQHFELYPT
jgi:hypothetical protein